LHGKVIVLEFWATWCPSCVKMIPHLNDLAGSLKGQPIQFISVTDEKQEVVEAFLAKTPIHGWIGFNWTGSMFRSFGIDQGRPMTVVIRPDGTVDARIRPWVPSLTSSSLMSLAAGRPSGLEDVTEIFAGTIHDENGKPLQNVWVWITNRLDGDGWRELGLAMTDERGRFRIVSDDPPSYIEEYPTQLRFKRSQDVGDSHTGRPLPPKNPDGMVEDLRLLSPGERANLDLVFRTGPIVRWSKR
jgi:hypothetical protein